MSRRIPFPKIEVDWVDAECSPTWTSDANIPHELEEQDAEACCTTRGYEIGRSKKWLTIASTVGFVRQDRSWNFTAVMWIPRGMVRRIRGGSK